MCQSTARTALLCCLLLWQLPAQAINTIQLQIGQWSFEDYAAEQFDISLNLTDNGLQLKARTDKLILPGPMGTIEQVQLSCEQLRLRSENWQCLAGELRFQHEKLGKQQLAFSIKAKPENQRYQISLQDLRLAEARVNIDADYQPSNWTIAVSAKQLSLQALSDWLPLVLTQAQIDSLSIWQYQGKLDLDARVKGNNAQPEEIKLDWQTAALSFSNEAGTQVAEGVSGRGHLAATLDQQQWQWQISVKTGEGQVYSDPVFLDLKQHPLSAEAMGKLASDFNSLDVNKLKLEQQTVLNADAAFHWSEEGLKSLQIKTQPASLDNLYTIWLQPFTLGTAAAKLKTTGRMAMELDWQADNYQLQLSFNNASMSDEQGRFNLQDLNGDLGWSNSKHRLETRLSWSQAKLFAVELGEAAISAESVNNTLTLTDSLHLPVLDGNLQVNAFDLQQRPDGHVDWHFDGLLTPISMESLSQALEWPTLHGKLSGVIPRVSYSNQQLKIDGALQVKVFDGTTVIRDLRMSSPFGSLPQLYANIDINSLDLELLTQTFDFGRISGRLEGYVHNLRLSNWEPVQFDASLATPENNPGKRRISQKAVDNLTQIGGGATGMLSRSFLRFFDDFSYQKLGLACRLQNDVCQMSGIEEAEQGYYIVKGGGGLPPYINVVGYTRRVDWADLIARLLAVRDSSGPVIE